MSDRFGFGATLQIDVTHAVKNMDHANQSRHRLEQGFTKMSIGLSQMASGMQRVTQGILTSVQQMGTLAAVGAVASGREFLKFEDSIVQLGTVLDDGQKGAQGMRKEIERIAIASGKGGAEISKAAALARGSGIVGAEALDFVREASKGAVANYASVNGVVDAGTSIINAYGKSLFVAGTAGQKMAAINDVMTVSVLEGKHTMEQMAQFIGLGASEAAQAGVDFRELAAMYSTLTLAGQGASRSVVNLGQIMRQFTNPAKEAIELAAQHGIVLNRAYIKQHGGIVGSLRAMNKQLGGNYDLLAQIIGTEVRAARALSGLANGSDNYDRILKRIYTDTGIADERFKDVSNTIVFQLRQALVGFQMALARAGKAFFDVFGEVGTNALMVFARNLDQIEAKAHSFFQRMKHGFDLLANSKAAAAIGVLATSFGKFFGVLAGGDRNAQDMAIALGALATVATPLLFLLTPMIGILGGALTMLASMVPLVGGSVAVFGMLAGAVKMAVDSFFALAALSSLKVVLVALGAAVAVFGGVLYAIINNAAGFRDTLVEVFTRVGVLIQTVFSPIINGLSLAFEIVGGVIGVVGTVIGKAMLLFIEPAIIVFKAFGIALNWVVDRVRDLWRWLGKLFGPMWQNAIKIVDETAAAMRKFGGEIAKLAGPLDAITDQFAGAGASVKGWVMDTLEWFGVVESRAEQTAKSISSILNLMDPGRFERELNASRLAKATAIYEGGKKAAGAAAGYMAENAPKAGKWLLENAEPGIGRGAPTPLTPMLGLVPRIQVEATLKNRVCVDGRDLNIAVTTAQATMTERGGSALSPWQSKMARTYGGGIPKSA